MLCDYIIYRGFDFRDKTVVDLGSGTGLTSVVAALFANTVYCTGKSFVGVSVSSHLCILYVDFKVFILVVWYNVQCILYVDFKV